ncbi:MAG TPA: DUF72 domain-containing protein [Burkholderiales bacterium]
MQRPGSIWRAARWSSWRARADSLYKEWCGRFYPEKLPGDRMLHYYAERLPTVEINNTFYRMPAESMLARWAAEVPPGFTFTLKAPRRITHEKRLADAGADIAEFVRRAAALGDRLGVILLQLPPFLKKDLGRLERFLDVLPQGTRAAFEFRHTSWHSEDVHDALRARRAMLCVTDTDEGEARFVATAPQGYLRLRRTHYDDAELGAWAERIAGAELARTYVYFMHEDDALGTGWAARLMEHWRRRVPRANR